MARHVIEFDSECKSCKATGLYIGMAERDGAAVVCRTCRGSGCEHIKIEYDDFEGRRERPNVRRVHEVNPGIIINDQSRFGGMYYQDWLEGKDFPVGSENRSSTCPAWWYQSADYKKKPKWKECNQLGRFRDCPHFEKKSNCWERFDEEQREKSKMPNRWKIGPYTWDGDSWWYKASQISHSRPEWTALEAARKALELLADLTILCVEGYSPPGSNSWEASKNLLAAHRVEDADSKEPEPDLKAIIDNHASLIGDLQKRQDFHRRQCNALREELAAIRNRIDKIEQVLKIDRVVNAMGD